MKILNFGSLNLDNVYQVPHFLQAGETMAALSEAVHPGGKGLNQSLALARAGAEVYHAGVVGNGSELLTNLLKENGVHDDYLLHRDCTQGSTMIQVSPKGENCILLFGQSNHAITKAQVEETIAAFAPGDYLVLQNEVSCLPEMVEAGAKRGLHVVLNPSPFDDSLRSLDYNQIRWIFINEVEGHQMTGETAPDAILSALRAKYPALCVVLTLGSAGSICCTPENVRIDLPVVQQTLIIDHRADRIGGCLLMFSEHTIELGRSHIKHGTAVRHGLRPYSQIIVVTVCSHIIREDSGA